MMPSLVSLAGQHTSTGGMPFCLAAFNIGFVGLSRLVPPKGQTYTRAAPRFLDRKARNFFRGVLFGSPGLKNRSPLPPGHGTAFEEIRQCAAITGDLQRGRNQVAKNSTTYNSGPSRKFADGSPWKPLGRLQKWAGDVRPPGRSVSFAAAGHREGGAGFLRVSFCAFRGSRVPAKQCSRRSVNFTHGTHPLSSKSEKRRENAKGGILAGSKWGGAGGGKNTG